MIELRFRSFLFAVFLLLAALLVLLVGFGLRRYQAFASQPRSLPVVQEPSPGIIAPAGSVPATLTDVSSAWDARFTVSEAEVQAALAARYPGLSRRFPDGMLLTVTDEPSAPEALRGPYDPQPARLRLGAVWPEPLPGASVTPTAEAWADCRHDLELGPARHLHCYLYVRGDPGPTLDGLAVLAWTQALDYALAGRTQPLDRQTLPFLNAARNGDTWTYTDAFLSLTSPVALTTPVASPSRSPLP